MKSILKPIIAYFSAGALAFSACAPKSSSESKKADRIITVTRGVEELVGNFEHVQYVIGSQAPYSDSSALASVQNRFEEEAKMEAPSRSIRYDVDVSNPDRGNQVVLGTPQHNTLVDKVRSRLSEDHPLPPTGTGVIECIKVPDGAIDIVVTGRSPDDVSRAAYVLANYDRTIPSGDHVDLSGRRIYVTGSLNDPMIIIEK